MNINSILNNQKRSKGYFIQAYLSIIIIFTIIQQMPFLKDNYYEGMRYILYALFGSISVYSFQNINKLIKNRLIFRYFLIIIYVIFLLILSMLMQSHRGIELLMELVVPFGVLISSANIEFSRKNQSKIMNIYIFLSIILGLYSILYYVDGFTITNQYLIKSKNQIGPILGISCVMSLYIFFNPEKFCVRKIIVLHYLYLVAYFILLFSIIIFRNRATLVGLGCISVILLIKNKKVINYKKIISTISILIILIILFMNRFFDHMIGMIWDSFTLNYNITDLNSLSAGRVDGYIEAIEYSLKYPLFGETMGPIELIYTTHNYILNKWVRFGIVGSLPIILFYIYLWLIAIRELLGRKSYVNDNLSAFLLLFSLIISFFEYTYPFGPGVTQIMIWFLIGQKIAKKIN